ncbi:hypothetical protein Taro_020300, partial [Colocasia esculenta]|nr:hypothetical protein [Colocasia esculenta]
HATRLKFQNPDAPHLRLLLPTTIVLVVVIKRGADNRARPSKAGLLISLTTPPPSSPRPPPRSLSQLVIPPFPALGLGRHLLQQWSSWVLLPTALAYAFHLHLSSPVKEEEPPTPPPPREDSATGSSYYMSILGSSAGSTTSTAMGTPFFLELKKQASCFFKDKIRTARLALTDVTPAQLLAEEATNGNPWAPDTRTMGFISRAAFELDNYWRIVDLLHMRLARFDRKQWRESYKALILLEHLLTHGPASVAEEFQIDRDIIKELQSFHHVDEKGFVAVADVSSIRLFNWGLAARKKSERVLKLLEKGPLLQEERDRARKLTRGIEGFGSFVHKTASPADAGEGPPASKPYGRSNTQYSARQDGSAEDDQKENSSSTAGPAQEQQLCKRTKAEQEPLKENRITRCKFNGKELGIASRTPPPEESNPLLGCGRDGPGMELQREDHPFNYVQHQSTELLLRTRN